MNAIKKNGVFAVALALAFTVSQFASANELLVTPAQSKSANTSIALDIVSDGDVSGFQFALDFGNTKIAKANLSRCLSELPSTFAGECRQVGSKIYVIAMANQMVALPAGVIPVGQVTIPSVTNARTARSVSSKAFVITDLEFVGVKVTF